ncbi:MAG: hypothetical protein ACI4TW_04965 [Prevotella sp.]
MKKLIFKGFQYPNIHVNVYESDASIRRNRMETCVKFGNYV